MHRMKQQIDNYERKLQKDEILDDNHPNFLNFFKGKIKEREDEILHLKKRLRNYMLQEKRVLVKEKAFEVERAENFRVVVGLNNDLRKEKVKNAMNEKKFRATTGSYY